MAWKQRDDYCQDCWWWRHFGGFYGCYKHKVYSYDERDRLCGRRDHRPRNRRP